MGSVLNSSCASAHDGGKATSGAVAGAVPAPMATEPNYGSDIDFRKRQRAASGDGGTGGLATSGGATAAGAAMPTGGAVNSSLGGSGGSDMLSRRFTQRL